MPTLNSKSPLRVKRLTPTLSVYPFPIEKIVSIPVGWWLTPEEREYIVKCIKKGW